MKASQIPFLQKYLFLSVHLKGLLTSGFAKKYYSQFGEDVALGRLCSSKKNGFYVDVGAYHPKHYSNTYLLYKKGWHGINIDPNPDSIRLFNLYRRRDINVNCGIDESVSERPYFIFNHQSCNTFSREQKELMLQKSFISLIKETTIACRPLQGILDMHASGIAIDVLNVDVEGMNLQVLNSIDWNKTHPAIICIEDDDFNFQKSENFGSEIFALLTKQGYGLDTKIGLSCVYTQKQ